MSKKIFSGTILLVIAVFFLASCSKEAKFRKNLSGTTWSVISSTDDTISTALAFGYILKYRFDDCKKKDEPCSGLYTLTLGSLSQNVNFTWVMNDDVLTITPDSSSGSNIGSVRLDFTETDKVVATDVSNGRAYTLQRQ